MTLGQGQQFNVIVDTGSNDLWLPSNGAGPGNTVQADSSIQPYPDSPSCTEAYGGGNQGISGTIYTAPYTFAGTNANGAFCLVDNEGTYGASADGILGLGFCQGSSVTRHTGDCPLHALGWSSFGIYLSSDDQNGGGFITPNGIDGGLYSGDFAWESLVPNPTHWAFDLGGGQYNINGFQGNLINSRAFIDTGNPTINVDSDSATKIWQQVGANSDGTIDCNLANGGPPDIIFTFGSGNQYSLPPHLYVVYSPRQGQCICAIQPMTVDPTANPAVFGAPFIKAYYTWFDNSDSAIGFAPSVG